MDARKLLRAVSFTVPIFTLPIFAGAFVGAARLAAQETGSGATSRSVSNRSGRTAVTARNASPREALARSIPA